MKRCKDCKHQNDLEIDGYTACPFMKICQNNDRNMYTRKWWKFWAAKALLITLALLLCGCSNSKFALDLTERKLTTERWNSELDIGKIEYIEKANGDTHITVTSYKLAQAEMPLEWMRLAAAMYGGDVAGVAGVIREVKP